MEGKRSYMLLPPSVPLEGVKGFPGNPNLKPSRMDCSGSRWNNYVHFTLLCRSLPFTVVYSHRAHFSLVFRMILSFAPQSQSLSCAEGHRFLSARFVIPETANLPESGMPAGWNTHIKARYHTALAIPLPSNQSDRSFLNTLADA